MTLPKEWHQEAKENGYIQFDYTHGATAYKQAVEKLLSDRQQELLADKINAVGEEEQTQYDLLIVEIALFLNKLKFLTPTSND
jgi:BioD-like phosphotransacetylase family protein